ncbi:hypothetical protein GXB85_05225 [Cellulomonas sp. APG4]|uniref:septum formation family protein n=1 Tax=Cellulomonas sp. APG4 TaxID=1538656 RepID=UPI00137A7DFE|nr:septum formation family protein [Cellulomonas sp. APG4]NCT90355.1 hypothetical protein [Cellulomonas sp. APG4]
MTRTARTAARTLVVAGLLATTVTGCSLFGPGDPVRDDETGEITEASDASVFSIKVGDCMDSSTLADEVESVPAIPCGEPHDTEVYAAMEFPEGDYPADLEDQADEFCYGEFSTFVGMAYEDSELDYTLLYPQEEGWTALDDREVTCLLLSAEPVTGTLKGAAR